MISQLGIEFDHHDYYARGDTLYLHVGPAREPARSLETPEGHTVEYDERGAITGLELLNVRWALERDGKLTELAAGRARRRGVDARHRCGLSCAPFVRRSKRPIAADLPASEPCAPRGERKG